jgi:hypothetical protein
METESAIGQEVYINIQNQATASFASLLSLLIAFTKAEGIYLQPFPGPDGKIQYPMDPAPRQSGVAIAAKSPALRQTQVPVFCNPRTLSSCRFLYPASPAILIFYGA